MNEQWLEIPELKGSYSVSNLGRVRSNPRKIIQSNGRVREFQGKIKSPNKSREGYISYNMFLDSKCIRRYAHRLVAEAFIENTDKKPQVNHIDGDKENNSVSNLEWVTASENCKHAIATGIYQTARGEASACSKITEGDVREIRRMAKDGVMHKDIAPMFGIGRKAITKIVNRQRWAHVTD